MPVYLCCPGKNKNEPWNHFIQVYAAPFELIKQKSSSESVSNVAMMSMSMTMSMTMTMTDMNNNNNNNNESTTVTTSPNENTITNENPEVDLQVSRNNRSAVQQQQQLQQQQLLQQFEIQKQQSIRRIRHSEIIIVDDVCIAYNLYWLRIRWPGKNSTCTSTGTNHFAGYIAMEATKQWPPSKSLSIQENNINTKEDDNDDTLMLLQYNEATNTTTVLSVPSTTGKVF
jgi:hypothetical protein